MSWPWSYPSEEEASEAYYYFKDKYNSAAYQKQVSERNEQQYLNEKSAASSQIKNLSTDRVNFEKRLKGIEEIIKILEGNGGWFSTNIPQAISQAQHSLERAQESFQKSIVLSGGSNRASLSEAFALKTVEADANSSAALQEYRKEKNRLEQEIANIKQQVANLEVAIAQLVRQIKSCNIEQSSLRSSMNSYAYEMNHYRRYM